MLEIDDIKGNLDEAKQEVSHRLMSEIERVQDNTELLFSTWAETLKQEVEERQDKLIQHAEGKSLAAELQMRDLNNLAQLLTTQKTTIEEFQKDTAFLKVTLSTRDSSFNLMLK